MESKLLDLQLEELSLDSCTETDLLNFERKQREFLHELNRKRLLLDECRQELNEAISKQHELQCQLDSERRKNENHVKNMTLLNMAVKTMEETRLEDKENHNKQKAELEIAKVERDALREQNKVLQHEEVKLKRQLEDLEGKYNCQTAFQRDITNQQTKIKNLISQLVSSNQNLMKDKEKLESIEKSLGICSQLKLFAELNEKEKQKAVEQKDQMEKELIIKTAELRTMKELFKNSPLISSSNDELLEYWKNIAQQQKERLAIEIEGTTQLTTALEAASRTICKYEHREIAMTDKIKKLEDTLNQGKTVDHVGTQTEELGKIDDKKEEKAEKMNKEKIDQLIENKDNSKQ